MCWPGYLFSFQAPLLQTEERGNEVLTMLTLLRLDKLCLQLKGRIIPTVKAMPHGHFGQPSIDPLCGGPVVSVKNNLIEFSSTITKLEIQYFANGYGSAIDHLMQSLSAV